MWTLPEPPAVLRWNTLKDPAQARRYHDAGRSSLGGFYSNYAMGHIIGHFGSVGVFVFEGGLCLRSFLIALTLPSHNAVKEKASTVPRGDVGHHPILPDR